MLATSMHLQVDLTEPILSRFDILCVVRDIVDPVEVQTASVAQKKNKKKQQLTLQYLLKLLG